MGIVDVDALYFCNDCVCNYIMYAFLSLLEQSPPVKHPFAGRPLLPIEYVANAWLPPPLAPSLFPIKLTWVSGVFSQEDTHL